MARRTTSSRSNEIQKEKKSIQIKKNNSPAKNGTLPVKKENNGGKKGRRCRKTKSLDTSCIIEKENEVNDIGGPSIKTGLTTNCSETHDSYLKEGCSSSNENDDLQSDKSSTIVPSINVELNQTFRDLSDSMDSTMDRNFNESSFMTGSHCEDLDSREIPYKIVPDPKRVHFNDISIAAPQECFKMMQEGRKKFLIINDNSCMSIDLELQPESELLKDGKGKKKKKEKEETPVLRRSERLRQKRINMAGNK